MQQGLTVPVEKKQATIREYSHRKFVFALAGTILGALSIAFAVVLVRVNVWAMLGFVFLDTIAVIMTAVPALLENHLKSLNGEEPQLPMGGDTISDYPRYWRNERIFLGIATLLFIVLAVVAILPISASWFAYTLIAVGYPFAIAWTTRIAKVGYPFTS